MPECPNMDSIHEQMPVRAPLPRRENYYWTKHGVKPAGAKYRYKIYVDESWLSETENPYSKESIIQEQSPERWRPVVHEMDSSENRRKLRESMLAMLWHQWSKSEKEYKRKEYAVYSITRAGAPGAKEWLCWRTHCLAAVSSDSKSVDKWKSYWLSVRRFSAMAYNYVASLEYCEYPYLLHLYLKRLIVFPSLYPHEIKRFNERFNENRGWGILEA